MEWVILVLTATLIWSIGATINKYARVSYFENSLGYVIFVTPVAFFVLLLLFFQPFYLLNIREAVIVMLIGIIGLVGFYFYLEALHREEMSRVFILFGIGALITLVLSTIFLKEILTMNQYIAFVLILAGSILISFKKTKEKFKFSTGALFVLVSALLFSIQNVLMKYVSEINLTTMMFYRQFGILTLIVLVFLTSSKARRYTKKVIKDLNIKKTALVYSAEITGMTGLFLIYLAIQKGPVSLVTVLEGFEMIFILIIVIVMSVFFPKILKETIDKKTLSIKIISALLMLSGLYFITL